MAQVGQRCQAVLLAAWLCHIAHWPPHPGPVLASFLSSSSHLVHRLETVSPKKPQNNSAGQWSFCDHVRNRDLVPPVELAMLPQSQPIRWIRLMPGGLLCNHASREAFRDHSAGGDRWKLLVCLATLSKWFLPSKETTLLESQGTSPRSDAFVAEVVGLVTLPVGCTPWSPIALDFEDQKEPRWAACRCLQSWRRCDVVLF